VRDFPARRKLDGIAGIDDGLCAMRFIRAAISSSANGSAWTPLEGIENRS
jgi:hypothetical protein